MPARPAQPALPDTLVGGRKRIYCHNPACRRELTDPVSRARGFGKTCDPENHPGASRPYDIEQDPIPGT